MKKMFACLAAATLILAACNNEKKKDGDDKDKMESTNSTQQEKNKQTALASVNALIAGDVEGTLKNVAADGIDYGDGSMPPIKSKDSVKAMLQSWRGALSEYKVDNLWAMADGDNVAVFGDWTLTFNSDFMGMKTNGKTVKIKDVDIFKFNSEGMITEHRNIQSSAEMMKQLGMDAPK